MGALICKRAVVHLFHKEPQLRFAQVRRCDRRL